MTDPIEEAMGHLGAALMQTHRIDDPVTVDHIREAHKFVQAAYRAQRQQQRDAHRYQAAAESSATAPAYMTV